MYGLDVVRRFRNHIFEPLLFADFLDALYPFADGDG
jgi:hypothetical protein